TAQELTQTEFRKGTALANAFVALLASAKPRNLVNGTFIDTAKALSSYNRKEFHHLFPQAHLKSRVVAAEKINSLVNFCMLSAEQNKYVSDKKPSEYMAEFESGLGTNFVPVLESNLIPRSAIPFLKSDDYDGFLRVRAEFLAREIGRRV